jgi:excisionase family DNA binding protein
MEPERNKYLSTEDFIRLTGLSVRTFRRRLRSGEIPAVKSGNRLLIPASALPPEAMKVFLESRHIEGSDENQTEEEVPKSIDLTAGQRKEQAKRLATVEGFLQLRKDIPRGKIHEFKKSYAQLHGISRRTLDNYLRLYEEGGAAALVPGWTNGVSKKIINAEMRKFIERKYLRPHGPSLRMVFEDLCAEFQGKVDELPAYRTVTEFVNSTWTKANQLLVRDKALYDKKYSPFVRRDWEKVAVNECWIGDSKQIDIACLHNGKAIFPWFTAFLDARSRKFVGWVLTAVHDSLTIGQALCYGLAKHGAPKEIYVDRGKPYKSKFIAGDRVKEGDDAPLFADIEKTEMPGIVRDLGASIFFAAPYNAREKIIEPNFRIFTYRLTQLPGYRGHSIKTRPAKLMREIKEGKLLTLDQLHEEVEKLINARNARPHATTKQSPNSYYEGYAPIIPSQEILDYLLMDRNVRRVKDGTVSIGGFLYRGEQLWEYAGEEVSVFRDPKDLRWAVIVYKGKIVCKAELEIPGHYRDPITAEHAKTARRIRRDIKRKRQELIDGQAVSTDPVKLAAEIAHANQERTRDIRPAQSKVRGFHPKERLARDMREILAEEPADEMVQQAAAGGDILTRYAGTFNQAAPKRPSLSLESLSGPLSIFNSSSDDD